METRKIETSRMGGASAKDAHVLKKIAQLSVLDSESPELLFDEIVKTVGELADARMVSISEIRGEQVHYKHLYLDGAVRHDAGHCPIALTPCAGVHAEKKVVCYSNVRERFPHVPLLKEIDAGAYCGIPCLDSDNHVAAILCIVDDRKDVFDEDDIDLITVLGRRIGMEKDHQRRLAKHAAAEMRIRESEKKFRALFQTANDAIFMADTKVGMILDANPKAATLTGWSREELVGRHFSDLYPLEERSSYEAVFRRAVESGASLQGDISLLHKSGRRIPVEVSTNVLELNGNEVIQGIFRDLSEREAAKEELIAAKSRLEHLLTDGIAVIYSSRISDDYGATFISPNVRFQLGYEPERFLADPSFWISRIHPDDRDGIVQGLSRLFYEGTHSHEYRFRHSNGAYRWMHDELRLVKDENGRPLEVVGYWTDVTERKKTERELERYRIRLEEMVDRRTVRLKTANARLRQEIEIRKEIERELIERERSYRTLAENIPGIVFRIRAGNKGMEFFNDSLRELTGYGSVELAELGMSSIHDLVLPEDRRRVRAAVKKSLREGAPYEVEYRILCRRKEERHFIERGRPVKAGGARYIDGVILENTRQKTTEAALRLSEARLKTAQRTGKLGSYEWDLGSGEVFRSDENYRIFGFDPGKGNELTYADFIGRVHPDDREAVSRTVAESREKGKGYNMEYRIVLPDGGERVIHSRADLIHAGGREILTGVVHDITELREFEAKLKTFRAAIDHSDDCTFLIDPEQMRFIDFNRRAVSKLGYSKKELLSMGPQDINVNYNTEKLQAIYRTLEEDNRHSIKIETRYRRKNGKTFPVEINLSRVCDGQGKVIFIADARDITKRIMAEKALAASEERYRFFAQHFPGIAFQGELGGGINFLHGAVEEISGYTAKALKAGRPRWDHIFHPDDMESFLKGFDELRGRPGFSVRREYRIIRKNGTITWVEEVIQNVCDSDGKPARVQGAIFDITERKVSEELLRSAQAAADAANRAKSDFIADLSHELRTPMQTIIGMSQELQETNRVEDHAEYLRSIIMAGDSVLTLLNNVLDFSKIESGRIELETIPFELSRIAEESMNMVSFQAKRKGLMLRLEMDDRVPQYLTGDPVRLRQILVNLLSNAVKFTARGEVCLRINRAGGRGGKTKIRFEVEDTGIGIPAEKIDAVFDRYMQMDRSTARYFGGTGLGTSISKRLAEIMGGEMGCESREGEGSLFHFTIPFCIDGSVKIRQKGTGALPRLQKPFKILLVEDSADMQIMIDLFLKNTGASLDMAEDGRKGIDAFKIGAYDLILMDLEMPVMDGLDACREMRRIEAEEKREPTPIVALTGHAFAEAARLCLSAGFDAHLSKPMKKEVFLNAVNRYARTGDDPPPPSVRQGGSSQAM